MPSVDKGRFIGQVRALVAVANTTQVRMAPNKCTVHLPPPKNIPKFITNSKPVTLICQRFAEIHQEQGMALAAIRLLKTAITKLRPNSESLTPLHADFLQICLLAKDYRAALAILSEDVLVIASPDSYKFKPRDMLRYFYYGGMIYTGLKDFAKAAEFFKIVCISPTPSRESYNSRVRVSWY